PAARRRRAARPRRRRDRPGLDGRSASTAPVAGQPGGASPSGSPTTSPNGSSGPAGTAKPIGGELGRYSGINLSAEYKLSLTDDPTHPRKDSGDFTFWDLGNGMTGARFSVLDPGGAGSYEACRDNTRYTDRLDGNYMVKGKMICVYTDSGFVGLVRITGTGDKPTDYLTLDLTVWQGVPPTPGE
ncbi:serine/threonine protein kinase, partial [Spirillospora sp. NPDC049652]